MSRKGVVLVALCSPPSQTALARRGLSEEQITDLANSQERSDFTQAEKAALQLAERTIRDSNAVDDAFLNESRKYSRDY